ncbi:two component LuxR family transcriptional regulator [Sulfuricella denitrificans skB26]|uniref:Two component LuxR family transcriptional regulator n=1 Tax=Sulfuricella denitrificans (strain DSM 22764 / NBRC 105220 / skB26) TaxID=1163617 RepID=S6AL37_SULDS|nr:response regulator transcription factor [Sulfuricella denitrificans]BAN35339.1 two component LuxR family transcriptional regulator [Sulfuricella denitrificans skB26]
MPLADRHQISTAPRKKSNVLIVDDHPIVRQGIAQLINREDDMRVCCEAGDADQALEEIAKCDSCCNTDIALVDMSLPGISGLELVKTLRSRFPEIQILVISTHDESLYAERALRAGAKGYIMKQEATAKVLIAIRHILSGEVYLSEKMRSKILQRIIDNRFETPSSPVSHLSDKEIDVLRLIGKGLRTSEIAAELSRSVKTVEAHRANLKEKLGLKNATELVRFAVQWVESES